MSNFLKKLFMGCGYCGLSASKKEEKMMVAIIGILVWVLR